MIKSDNINLAQAELALKWKCSCDSFRADNNIFLQCSDSFFEMITFGKNVVIRADKLMYDWSVYNFSKVPANEIMDGAYLFIIEAKLREFGKKLAGEHVRYLYFNNEKTIPKPNDFEFRLFDKSNIKGFYAGKDFQNALNYYNDVIALGAYDGSKLVALAGADDGMNRLWQIGIDTLYDYRNNGLASYLVKTLADEIVKRGAEPYYTTWSANIASTTVAINTGFMPAWVEYYAEDL